MVFFHIPLTFHSNKIMQIRNIWSVNIPQPESMSDCIQLAKSGFLCIQVKLQDY